MICISNVNGRILEREVSQRKPRHHLVDRRDGCLPLRRTWRTPSHALKERRRGEPGGRFAIESQRQIVGWVSSSCFPRSSASAGQAQSPLRWGERLRAFTRESEGGRCQGLSHRHHNNCDQLTFPTSGDRRTALCRRQPSFGLVPLVPGGVISPPHVPIGHKFTQGIQVRAHITRQWGSQQQATQLWPGLFVPVVIQAQPMPHGSCTSSAGFARVKDRVGARSYIIGHQLRASHVAGTEGSYTPGCNCRGGLPNQVHVEVLQATV